MAEEVAVVPGMGLRWTYHPLMDMGIAGLTVFAGRERPEEVTAQDLDAFKEWALGHYFTAELTSWISVVFTSNFLNPTFSPEKKRAVLGEVLDAYKMPGALDSRCAFFPELRAQQRVARDLLPMLMGRGPMNFFPDGQPGVPLSGLAITALQGLSVAAPLVSGKVLIVTADDERALLALVQYWQGLLKKRATNSLTLSEKGKGWTSVRTRVVEGLRHALQALAKLESSKEKLQGLRGGLTAYHLSNSGQGPDVQVFPLAHPALAFLQQAVQRYGEVWGALVARSAWAAKKDKDEEHGRSVGVYEALFLLPQGAHLFISRYLKPPFDEVLKPPEPSGSPGRKGRAKEGVDRPPRIPIDLSELWALTEVFLKEVLAMEKARIDALRELGDDLARWIADENDIPLFREVYAARRPGTLRAILLKVDFDRARQDHPPLLTLGGYQRIFMEDEERARADFSLARDLLKMRLIERLHADERKPLVKNKAELEDVEVPAADAEGPGEGED